MQGIFLDRDGVINRERADYVKSWPEFKFLPGALAALHRLATLQIPIVVITNQSVIGRKIVSRQIIDDIHAKAKAEIQAAGGRVDEFFLCPHHPDEQCACRKPQPGLLQQAAEQFKLHLPSAVFIGDAITDYQAACAAGCQSILVQSGRQGARLHEYFTELVGQPGQTVAAGMAEGSERQSRLSYNPLAAPALADAQVTSAANATAMPPIVCDLAAAVELILKSGKPQ